MKSQKINCNLILLLLILVLSIFYSNQYSITKRKVYLKINKEKLDNIEASEFISYNFSQEDVKKTKTLNSKQKDTIILPISKSLIENDEAPISELKVFSPNLHYKTSLTENRKSNSKNFKNQSQQQTPLKQYDIEVSSIESTMKSSKDKNKEDQISFELNYTYKIDKKLKEKSLKKDKSDSDKTKLNFDLSTFDNAENLEENTELIVKFIGFKNGVKIEDSESEKGLFSNSNNKDGVTVYKTNLKLTNNSNRKININFTENPEENKVIQNKDTKVIDDNSKGKLKQANSNKPIEKKNLKILARQESDEVSSSKNSTSSESTETSSAKSPLMNILTIFYLMATILVCFLCFCITTPKSDDKDADAGGASNREGAEGADQIHS